MRQRKVPHPDRELSFLLSDCAVVAKNDVVSTIPVDEDQIIFRTVPGEVPENHLLGLGLHRISEKLKLQGKLQTVQEVVFRHPARMDFLSSVRHRKAAHRHLRLSRASRGRHGSRGDLRRSGTLAPNSGRTILRCALSLQHASDPNMVFHPRLKALDDRLRRSPVGSPSVVLIKASAPLGAGLWVGIVVEKRLSVL